MPLQQTIQPTVLDHTFVALVTLVLLMAVRFGQPAMKRHDFDTAAKIATYWGNSVLLWLGATTACIIWLLAGRSLAMLGFAPPQRAMLMPALLLVAGLLAAYLLDTWRQLRSPALRVRTLARWARDTPFMPATRCELRHYVALAVSAGLCEEVVFRGYLISYLTWFTGTTLPGSAAAVCIPAVVFGLSHLYQGWLAVLKIVLMAVAFGAIFLLTRSLWLPMALHLLIDLLGGWLTCSTHASGQPACSFWMSCCTRFSSSSSSS